MINSVSNFVYILNVKKCFSVMLFIFLMLRSNFAHSQTKDDIITLRQVTLESVQNAPNNEYKSYIDYYSKINLPEALCFRVKADLIRGNYFEAVNTVNQLKKDSENGNTADLFYYHFMAYQISHVLGVDADADEHKNELTLLFQKFETVTLELATDVYAFDFLSQQKKISYLENMLSVTKKRKDYFLTSRIYYFLGRIEFQRKNTERAYQYFEHSSSFAKKNGSKTTSDLSGNIGISSVLLAQGKYGQTYSLLSSKKNIIVQFPDILLKGSFYKNYARAAARLNLQEEVKWVSDNYFSLVTEDDNQKIRARSLLVDHIDTDLSNELENQKRNWKFIYIIFTAIFALLLGGILIRSKKRVPEHSVEVQEEEFDAKMFNIPSKTEKDIIEKLDKFESSDKYIKNNITLKSLSVQLNTNARYLSVLINKHKNMNFNTYINDLRIRYILQKLNDNEEYRKYKVSYLAEECGFSSHSLFTTTFKNIVGCSPIEYIKNLEKK